MRLLEFAHGATLVYGRELQELLCVLSQLRVKTAEVRGFA